MKILFNCVVSDPEAEERARNLGQANDDEYLEPILIHMERDVKSFRRSREHTLWGNPIDGVVIQDYQGESVLLVCPFEDFLKLYNLCCGAVHRPADLLALAK